MLNPLNELVQHLITHAKKTVRETARLDYELTAIRSSDPGTIFLRIHHGGISDVKDEAGLPITVAITVPLTAVWTCAGQRSEVHLCRLETVIEAYDRLLEGCILNLALPPREDIKKRMASRRDGVARDERGQDLDGDRDDGTGEAVSRTRSISDKIETEDGYVLVTTTDERVTLQVTRHSGANDDFRDTTAASAVTTLTMAQRTCLIDALGGKVT